VGGYAYSDQFQFNAILSEIIEGIYVYAYHTYLASLFIVMNERVRKKYL